MTRAYVLAVVLLGCKGKGAREEPAVKQAAAPADAMVQLGSGSSNDTTPIDPVGPTKVVLPRVARRASIATKPEPYAVAMFAIVDAKGGISVARATHEWRDHLPAIRTPARLEDLAETMRASSVGGSGSGAGSGSGSASPDPTPDDDPYPGIVHVRRIPDDPVLDRAEALETWRRIEEGQIGGRDHAIGAGAIRVERLGPRNPLVLAAANAPAATLARVLGVAGGALAVTSEDRPEILALGFVAPGSNHDKTWIELHAATDGIHVVDAAGAGAPSVVPWDKGTFDAKALATAIEKRAAPTEIEIDVLVGEGVSAQQLVEILQTLDAASAHRIGVGVLAGDREAVLRRVRDVRSHAVASLGTAITVGDLDKAIVRRFVHRKVEQIRFCYEKELVGKPKLAGTVTATFEIAATGVVTASTASGVDPAVATCVADVIKTIEFPKPKSGTVRVSYPFSFRPTGE